MGRLRVSDIFTLEKFIQVPDVKYLGYIFRQFLQLRLDVVRYLEIYLIEDRPLDASEK